MKLHRNNEKIAQAAREAGLDIEIHRFPEGTRTAADAARAIGCELGAIVKSLVLVADGRPVLVLTSGANRADYAKVAAHLGAADVRRADADEARSATGFPIGGTPPFGHPTPMPVLCDRDLLGYASVWAAAGTPDTVFPLTPQDLLRICDATPTDVAEA